MSTNRQMLLLVFLAALLLIPGISIFPYDIHGDEGEIAFRGIELREQHNPFKMDWMGMRAGHFLPVGYGMQVFGDTLFGARLSQALFAIASVPLFFLCAQHFSKSGAWLATILYIANPYFIHFGRINMGFQQVFFLILLFFWLVLLTKDKNYRWSIAVGLFSGAGLLSYHGVFVLPVFVIAAYFSLASWRHGLSACSSLIFAPAFYHQVFEGRFEQLLSREPLGMDRIYTALMTPFSGTDFGPFWGVDYPPFWIFGGLALLGFAYRCNRLTHFTLQALLILSILAGITGSGVEYQRYSICYPLCMLLVAPLIPAFNNRFWWALSVASVAMYLGPMQGVHLSRESTGIARELQGTTGAVYYMSDGFSCQYGNIRFLNKDREMVEISDISDVPDGEHVLVLIRSHTEKFPETQGQNYAVLQR